MDTLHGPPADTLALLILDLAERDHGSPIRLVAGLTSEEAFTRLPGAPNSVAQLLAHARANTEFDLRQLTSDDPNEVTAGELWPPVTPEQLPELITGFLDDLQALARLARDADLDRVVYPAGEGEPAWTVGYKLAASVTKHIRYHLGQIALLRMMATESG